jgi:type IV secretion system protein VirB10
MARVLETLLGKAMPLTNEQPQTSDSTAQLRATVENKAPKPAGLLPKNTQQLVILGVAVVMVLIMWLTGGTKRANPTPSNTPSATRVQPPNPATVEDFKQTIQQQQAASRQPISASDLARLKALGLADDAPPGTVVPPGETDVPQPGGVFGAPTQQTPPPPDPVKEDRKKREYLSLFAPNVAFTYRSGREAEQLVGKTGEASTSTPQSGNPENVDTQIRNAEAQLRSLLPPQSAIAPVQEKPKAEADAPNPDAAKPGLFNSFQGKRYVAFEGTVLETLLINRLNGSFPGPVNCLVTNDIYSHDRQHVLIPAGTKVLGEAKKVEAFGQQRLAVFFHRLIMPDGYSVNLDQFKGLDQIGESALRDKVNNHYLQIFGASLAIGVLGGIAEAGTGNAFTNSSLDQARAGFGANLANSSMQILDRFLNVLPTVTIREGHRVKVFLSGDLLLPDYNEHTIGPNL